MFDNLSQRLSLVVKRLREMVLGVPALIASHPIAARAGVRSASDRETPVNTELS
jgi:hypothetical protein